MPTLTTLAGVCEVHRFGRRDGEPASLLIELPHGATERAHYDAVAARLASPLPARLEQFFHVNTDFGVPELAREVAERVAGGTGRARTRGVVVVRALVPRTFIDFNRVIGEGAEAGMTPGLQPYITTDADRALLLSLYQQYHATVAQLYRETCGGGGIALTLHSYSPRSVEVEVDADIVTALRAAYRPAVYGSWALRPAVDFITRDSGGRDLSPPGLVAGLRAAYAGLGLDAGLNTAYHLHAASMGFRYSSAHPGRVLCAEFRRDLLGAPWRPFVPSRVGSRKVARLAQPLAEGLAAALSPPPPSALIELCSTQFPPETPPMTTVHRIFNFSAGPAVLPLPVLEEAREHLLALPGVGMSILEISHRSKPFEEICYGAEANLRQLAGVPDGYQVLFLQGGATLQFAMLAMNLLPAGATADYIETGVWSEKAIADAKRLGTVHIAGSSKATNHDRIPPQSEIRYSAAPAYVHMTSNNTIFGTQWHHLPEVPEGVPLVNDASSDIFCRPVDIQRYGMIYGGAQKNLSIAGLTLVVVREDLLGKAAASTPVYLNYATHAKERSLYNTPPVFGIYILHLVLKHLLAEGGLPAVEAKNRRKAAKLYAAIDASGGYYRGHAQPESRSWMNVTYRLPSEELEKKFVAEATAAGLDGLKGHRSVGGIRASIYNAFPEAGVDALVAFMGDFARRNG